VKRREITLFKRRKNISKIDSDENFNGNNLLFRIWKKKRLALDNSYTVTDKYLQNSKYFSQRYCPHLVGFVRLITRFHKAGFLLGCNRLCWTWSISFILLILRILNHWVLGDDVLGNITNENVNESMRDVLRDRWAIRRSALPQDLVLLGNDVLTQKQIVCWICKNSSVPMNSKPKISLENVY